MAEYRFDCRKCTNTAHGGPFDADYCLPQVSTGKWPGVFHDMGGSKKGDYFTCPEFTTEPRPAAIYEFVTVFDAEHPCNEPDWALCGADE